MSIATKRGAGGLGQGEEASAFHREPPASPRAQVRRPTGAQDLAWLEGTPDLGLALVPGLCQGYGRRAGHWRAADLRASQSLRQSSAPGTLRTGPGLPLQVWPASPSTPEEARIRCHQEPPSQQGKGPGRTLNPVVSREGRPAPWAWEETYGVLPEPFWFCLVDIALFALAFSSPS